MFGKKKNSSENTVALSQAEVDKILKTAKPQTPAKRTSKETEEKIRLLKEKTKAVEKKMKAAEKKEKSAKKPAAKKVAAKKTAAKKAPAKKAPAKKAPAKKAPAKKAAQKKPAAKKAVVKIPVYYEGKAFGTAAITTKNGKKIIEILSLRKK